MKAKTIKIVLKKKFADWLKSIKDDAVRKLVKKNTIITGGSIASMLLQEKVNDYDLYFRDKATAKAIAEYYVKQFKENPPPRFNSEDPLSIRVEEAGNRIKIVIQSAGIAGENPANNYMYFEGDVDPNSVNAAEYVEAASTVAEDVENKPPYRPVFLSVNAITLSGKIQLVIRFYGEPDEIHKNYDFVHCTNYWDSKTNHLELHKAALESLLTKELRYVGSKYPLCSVIRTRKFIARHWSINAGQYLKMLLQVSKLDLADLDVLEEQLVGVDTAYFLEIIGLLREKQKDGKSIDQAYVVEIIDRMF